MSRKIRPYQGEDSNRYFLTGKRFMHQLRGKVGVKDMQVVFYSLRKNFSTALESTGVLENHAQEIVGHAKASLTYSLYSAGASLEVLTEEVKKVNYGANVSRKVKRLIADIQS